MTPVKSLQKICENGKRLPSAFAGATYSNCNKTEYFLHFTKTAQRSPMPLAQFFLGPKPIIIPHESRLPHLTETQPSERLCRTAITL